METKTVELKLLVDGRNNRVVFAECGSEFVDLLLTFLTLPLSTIIRIIDKSPHLGSIVNLYESVAKLDRATFRYPNTQDMLLSDYTKPGEETHSIGFRCVQCGLWGCTSTLGNAACSCGRPMSDMCNVGSSTESEEKKGSVFVGKGLRFIVTDDLSVMPVSIASTFTLLQEQGVEDCTSLRDQLVYLGVQEILNLLRHSFSSKKPLTDAFLVSPNVVIDPNPGLKLLEKARELQNMDSYHLSVKLDENVKLKLFFNKKSGSVLYAEAREDVVNLLFGFFTFPLGVVVKVLLNGNSDLGCIDNLTNSIEVLGKENCMNYEINAIFNQNKCASFCLQNLVLPLVEEFSIPIYYHGGSCDHSRRSGVINVNLSQELIRVSGNFMITSDLDIVPSSSFEALSKLRENRIPFKDVEEKEIQIGQEEALTLLKASMRSKSALNDFVQAMFRANTDHSTCGG